MNETVVNLDELSYSRELFEAKPKPFVSMFIYMLVTIIVIAFTYAYIAKIEVVTTGKGLVRPNENIVTLVSETRGEIVESIVHSGMYVEKGQLLCRVNNDEVIVQKEFYDKQKMALSEKLSGLSLLKSSIVEGENKFQATEESISDYEMRYSQYVANADYIEYTNKSKVLQLSISEDSLTLNEARKKLVLENKSLNALKKLIQSGSDIALTSKEAQDYKHSMAKLKNSFKDAKDNYSKQKTLYEAGIISQVNYTNALNTYRDSELEYNQYPVNYVLDLNNTISANKSAIQAYDDKLRRASIVVKSIENEQENLDVLLEKHKSDALVSLNAEINKLEEEIAHVDKALEDVNILMDKSTITAPSSGWLDANINIEKGMIMSSGQEIAKVVPDTETEYIVELFIASNNISEVSVGQEVTHKIAVADNNNEYRGTVVSISPDIRMVDGYSGYLVRANLEIEENESKMDSKYSVKVGQSCETSIIISEEKVIVWLFNKLKS